MPSGMLLNQEEADRLSGEAPEMAGIVAFEQLGALLEQVVDRRDRQGDGEQQGDGEEAGDEIGDDAQPAELARLADVGEQADQPEDHHRHRPGSAREGEELGKQQDEQQPGIEEIAAQPLGEQVAEEEGDRQHQEGGEDVGILKGAHDAAVAQEDVAAGNDVEIPADAGERGQHGGGDIGLLDDRQPALRCLGDDRGEEDRRQHQEAAGRHVEDAAG